MARRRGSRIRGDSGQALLPTLAGSNDPPSRVGPVAEQEFDLEAASRQQRAKTLGPFDQRDSLAEGVLDAELPGFLRRFQAVKVEMPDRRLTKLVDLHQCEGRARHLLRTVARTDEAACKTRLAGAEIALQGDDIANLGECRNSRGQG